MDTLSTKPFVVRRYNRNDRAAVRQICCETGFLGRPIDRVFEDRDLFADFFTDYYLQCEPEAAFVVTIDDTVAGFLLGCRFGGSFGARGEKCRLLPEGSDISTSISCPT
jgi:hypothetical protein